MKGRHVGFQWPFLTVTQSCAIYCHKTKVSMFCSSTALRHTDGYLTVLWKSWAQINTMSLPRLRLQCTKQILKRKAYRGLRVCVGISCVRLTRDRLHTLGVWWPVLQPTSSGLDCSTKSFHITAISALPMAVRSRSLNPHHHNRNETMKQTWVSTSYPHFF